MGLSLQDIITRRAFDDEVIRSMLPSPVLHVEGYKTLEDIGAGRTASAADAVRGKILYYAAWYRFPILIGPGETTDEAVAVFNANVKEFPFSPPLAHITSTPLPWSPHVRPDDGLICQGEAWMRARGSMLLAHAIVHVARLLNCDEKDRPSTYVGYNEAAITYWRNSMGCRPLTPGLQYPVPSAEITHGIEALPQFRLVGDDDCDGVDRSNFQLVAPRHDGFHLVGGVQ